MITKISSKYILLILFLFLFQLFSAIAQITYSGEPLFNPALDTSFIPVIDLQVDAQYPLKAKNKDGLNYKVDEFAIPVEVSINTSDYGVWLDYSAQNKKVWLVRIKSENAISLNLIFDSYKLVPDVKVFLYNKDQQQIIGALNHRNNKPWNSLATSPINGDEVYIELQVPNYLSDFGEFNIGRVGVELQRGNLLKSTQDKWFNRSADCHINVNCYQNPEIQRQKRAVCRIVYLGSKRCTGTLLNNLNNDRTPYVLTAAHCFTTDFIAKDAVFGFNYESPVCDNVDGIVQSISGATVVSTVDSLDFVLLKLSQNLPIDYDAYYSGWDARGLPPLSSFILHHPEGDIQKISKDENEATTNSWGGKDPNTHWLVNDYETGSSEDGSSGCGLISDENFLIGTLTGGGETCSDLITDYYQKFSASYNDYPEAKNQLKVWLDPTAKNKLTCKGFDASFILRDNAQILTNISAKDEVQIISQSNDWGYLAGQNYQKNSLFAEFIQINGSKYLFGANIEFARIYNDTLNQGNVIFSLWEGGSVPGKLIYELPLTYSELQESINGKNIELEFDSTLLVHNSFYFGYRLSYASDTFAVKTAVTPTSENSAYTFIKNSWAPLQLDNLSYSSKLAVEILAFDFLPDKNELPDSNLLGNINIYPNPSNNQFQVFFKEGVSGKIVFKIFDISGRPLFTQEWLNPEPNVPIMHNLPSGVYIINIVENNRRIYARKILVL